MSPQNDELGRDTVTLHEMAIEIIILTIMQMSNMPMSLYISIKVLYMAFGFHKVSNRVLFAEIRLPLFNSNENVFVHMVNMVNIETCIYLKNVCTMVYLHSTYTFTSQSIISVCIHINHSF